MCVAEECQYWYETSKWDEWGSDEVSPTVVHVLERLAVSFACLWWSYKKNPRADERWMLCFARPFAFVRMVWRVARCVSHICLVHHDHHHHHVQGEVG